MVISCAPRVRSRDFGFPASRGQTVSLKLGQGGFERFFRFDQAIRQLRRRLAKAMFPQLRRHGRMN